MVNFGLNWSSLLGIVLAVAGAGLYFLRSWKPKLARDHDIFFAAVGLLCGGILLFQGWRLDPILAFGQFLLSGTAIFFAVESVNLRGAATAGAKSRNQIVDEERPVSNAYAYDSYDAEVERLEPEEDYPPRPRIRASQDPRSTRDSYDEEPRRRPSTRSNSTPRPDLGEKSRRRPVRPASPTTDRPDDWEGGDREDKPTRTRNTRPPGSEIPNPETSTRPKRSRSPEESRPRRSRGSEDATPADYVEYRPVDYPNDDPNNSTNFDS
ncbi:Ycf66 family protein [Kamptonema sp. UHCC 0994]|uniref:Ycf66 family protein n=1 Tax=Kamptonema sp. UHCC 0994 TaxID=3031329 RepID=UPI0023B88F12|nr:Ycf66 family protein [Kamptonema sp. UHCC 0994]MDF0555108.1 Ycf66 family protein [Kamptonema sp. UHCC 0994]